MKKSISKLLFIILIVSGNILNAQLFTNYTTSNGLPDNYISGGVAIDTNNNKWLGTAAGVAKFDNNTWISYTTTNGLIDNFTNCIAVDKNNNIWVGTNIGVSRYNGSSWTNFTSTDGLIDNNVTYIAADVDGSVWFATSLGVSKFNGTNWTSYTTSNGLPTNLINYIAIDSSGSKWFGTQMQGVSVFNNSTFTNITQSIMDSLIDNNVSAIAIDKFGQKWIGTWYGITKLDNMNNWSVNYRMIDGLYNEFVRDIKVDLNNNIWVGMFADYNLDGGISVFDGNNWSSYSVTDGLADKQVVRLAVDKDNNVWIATGNGVSKFINSVGIRNYARELTYSAYPNPASNILYINHGSNDVTISVFDLRGKLIKNYSLNGNSREIDVADLKAGMYILRIANKEETISIKLVKN